MKFQNCLNLTSLIIYLLPPYLNVTVLFMTMKTMRPKELRIKRVHFYITFTYTSNIECCIWSTCCCVFMIFTQVNKCPLYLSLNQLAGQST